MVALEHSLGRIDLELLHRGVRNHTHQKHFFLVLCELLLEISLQSEEFVSQFLVVEMVWNNWLFGRTLRGGRVFFLFEFLVVLFVEQNTVLASSKRELVDGVGEDADVDALEDGEEYWVSVEVLGQLLEENVGAQIEELFEEVEDDSSHDQMPSLIQVDFRQSLHHFPQILQVNLLEGVVQRVFFHQQREDLGAVQIFLALIIVFQGQISIHPNDPYSGHAVLDRDVLRILQLHLLLHEHLELELLCIVYRARNVSTLRRKHLKSTVGVLKILHHDHPESRARTHNDTLVHFLDLALLNDVVFVNVNGEGRIPHCLEIVEQLAEFEVEVRGYLVSVYFGPLNIGQLADLIVPDRTSNGKAGILGVGFLTGLVGEEGFQTLLNALVVLGGKSLLENLSLNLVLGIQFQEIEPGVGAPDVSNQNCLHYYN